MGTMAVAMKGQERVEWGTCSLSQSTVVSPLLIVDDMIVQRNCHWTDCVGTLGVTFFLKNQFLFQLQVKNQCQLLTCIQAMVCLRSPK